MTRAMLVVLTVFLLASTGAPAAAQGRAAKPAAPTGPMMVIETAKGNIEVELFPNDAPKTVEHITALVKRNFYNGLRVHRVLAGFVAQFGDPQTRDMTKRAVWGTGGSGRAIGASEVKRKHTIGSVGVAHPDPGDPKQADSQIYIAFAPQPKLDKTFTVFGQVVSGMDVARKLALTDVIRRVTIK